MSLVRLGRGVDREPEELLVPTGATRHAPGSFEKDACGSTMDDGEGPKKRDSNTLRSQPRCKESDDDGFDQY